MVKLLAKNLVLVPHDVGLYKECPTGNGKLVARVPLTILALVYQWHGSYVQVNFFWEAMGPSPHIIILHDCVYNHVDGIEDGDGSFTSMAENGGNMIIDV